MAPDDAVRIIRSLEADLGEQLFICMPVEYARTLRQLCDYEEESAAGIMTTDYVSLYDDITIAEVVEILREKELQIGRAHV